MEDPRDTVGVKPVTKPERIELGEHEIEQPLGGGNTVSSVFPGSFKLRPGRWHVYAEPIPEPTLEGRLVERMTQMEFDGWAIQDVRDMLTDFDLVVRPTVPDERMHKWLFDPIASYPAAELKRWLREEVFDMVPWNENYVGLPSDDQEES